MSADKVFVRKDNQGKFYWIREAPSGEPVSDSNESYENKGYTMRMAVSKNEGCVVIDQTSGEV